MDISSLSKKKTCSHRFIDQDCGRCLHCGYDSSLAVPSLPTTDRKQVSISIDDNSLELEHYERLVSMLDEWKKSKIDRLESIYKSKLQRLRDQFERQQAERRRRHCDASKSNLVNIKPSNIADLTNIHCQLIHTNFIDTEYTLMVSSSETVLLHDGRTLKLFNRNLRPLAALDLSQLFHERCKVVDICYATYLSAYLILHEHGLCIFQPGSNTANRVPSIQRRTYISLTCNSKDLFLLDIEGTIEQRSLVSWIYLRSYSRQHLLNDCIQDQLLSICCHAIESTRVLAIVRTINNRRSLIMYQHYGSNSFKLLNRIVFPNENISTVSSMHMSHVWLLTTCQHRLVFFSNHQHEQQQQQQQVSVPLDGGYRIKNAIEFSLQPRSIIVRTARPNQIRLYEF
jgi:hypothetical protein